MNKKILSILASEVNIDGSDNNCYHIWLSGNWATAINKPMNLPLPCVATTDLFVWWCVVRQGNGDDQNIDDDGHNGDITETIMVNDVCLIKRWWCSMIIYAKIKFVFVPNPRCSLASDNVCNQATLIMPSPATTCWCPRYIFGHKITKAWTPFVYNVAL